MTNAADARQYHRESTKQEHRHQQRLMFAHLRACVRATHPPSPQPNDGGGVECVPPLGRLIEINSHQISANLTDALVFYTIICSAGVVLRQLS